MFSFLYTCQIFFYMLICIFLKLLLFIRVIVMPFIVVTYRIEYTLSNFH